VALKVITATEKRVLYRYLGKLAITAYRRKKRTWPIILSQTWLVAGSGSSNTLNKWIYLRNGKAWYAVIRDH